MKAIYESAVEPPRVVGQPATIGDAAILSLTLPPFGNLIVYDDGGNRVVSFASGTDKCNDQ